MRIDASAATIGLVWDLLHREPVRTPDMARIIRRAASIAAAGYAAKHEAEDMFFDLGMPLEMFEGWTERLGFPWETIFHRPGAKAVSVLGGRHISAVHLAVSLIRAERLGIAVDPMPLVQAVRPALLKKPLLTEHEISVLWFTKERHRDLPMLLASEGAQVIPRWAQKPHKLATGYKAFPTFDGDAITALQVYAPRYRSSKPGALH